MIFHIMKWGGFFLQDPTGSFPVVFDFYMIPFEKQMKRVFHSMIIKI